MPIFISYQTENRSFALKLRENLAASDCQTWMDTFDIPKGAYWPDEIDKALRNSDIVVGILSPQSVDSRNVKNEWDWAILNKRKLILLMVEKCYIPMNYISINYIDFTNDFNTAFLQLLKAVGNANHEPDSLSSHNSTPISPPLDTLLETLSSNDDGGSTNFASKIVKAKRQTVTLDLVVLSSGDRYTVELPLDGLVNLIVRELAKQIGLPKKFDDGRSVVYELYNKTQAKMLDGNLTFRQNSVNEGDTLSFHISMVAG